MLAIGLRATHGMKTVRGIGAGPKAGLGCAKTKPVQLALRRVCRALAGFIKRPQAVDQIGANRTLLGRRAFVKRQPKARPRKPDLREGKT